MESIFRPQGVSEKCEQSSFFVARRLKPSVPIFITYSEPTALVVEAVTNIRKKFDMTDL